MTDQPCPWTRNSQRKRFYRPDWGRSPDCEGCPEHCDGRQHRCHVFGIPGFCDWPSGLKLDQWREPWWYPDREPSLAEKWLPPYDGCVEFPAQEPAGRGSGGLECR
jgi:hypothetical protein